MTEKPPRNPHKVIPEADRQVIREAAKAVSQLNAGSTGLRDPLPGLREKQAKCEHLTVVRVHRLGKLIYSFCDECGLTNPEGTDPS